MTLSPIDDFDFVFNSWEKPDKLTNIMVDKKNNFMIIVRLQTSINLINLQKYNF